MAALITKILARKPKAATHWSVRVVDNYATHKHPKVRAWLARRPRWHIHFTPTSAPWLNQVERFFALITQRAICRGLFESTTDLVKKIDRFIRIYNANSCPFVWTPPPTPSSRNLSDFVSEFPGQNTDFSKQKRCHVLEKTGIARAMAKNGEPEQRCSAANGAPLWALRGVGKLACFACLVLLLAILFNALITSGLRRINTSSFGVWNRIVDGTINAEIVISGSSRALAHYDSRTIEERTGLTAFNIGLNGSQTDMQLARLKTYLLHNKKPSLLIHNLDLFSFQTTHGGAYDPGQYVPYLQEPPIYAALARIDPDVWKARFLPLYGYAAEDLRFNWILGAMGFFGWNPPEDHFLGFRPRSSAWTEDFERFKAMNPDGVRFEIEADGVKQMEELLRLCKGQGIKVILIYSPEYREMQTFTTNRAQIFERFGELTYRFGAAVWDYSSSPISARRENFHNSQHLNAEGAMTFSKDLAENLAADPILGLGAARPYRKEKSQ